VAATRSARAPLTAYVLHHYDWSESSLILDLYTRENGRLAVAAKGAKKPHSNFRSVLLPFQRIQVSLSGTAARDESSNSEVQTLRAAEWGGGAAMLTGAALFSGYYLNELLMKLLARHDPHPVLFDAYALALAELRSNEETRVQTALRAFELTLLQQTGVLPELSLVTPTQQPVQPGRAYGLSPDAGVVVGGEIDGAILVGVQAALQHGSFAALQQACRPALPELRTALRAWIQHQLGHAILRTRQVMRDVQAL